MTNQIIFSNCINNEHFGRPCLDLQKQFKQTHQFVQNFVNIKVTLQSLQHLQLQLPQNEVVLMQQKHNNDVGLNDVPKTTRIHVSKKST